jgi:hypothetical protein
MKLNRNIINFLGKKATVFVLITATAIAAFASLGDNHLKNKKASLLNNKSMVTPGKFSLKSGYQYRGSQIINQQKSNNFVTLNSIVTYQKGNLTYILPLKTMVNTQKIKISIGIPLLNKN